MGRECSIKGCDKPIQARGICFPHYSKFRNNGTLTIGVRVWKKPHDRFLSYIEISESCWNWKSSVTKEGYGRIVINKRYVMAHRYSYEYYIGGIPKGLEIDHKCRNKGCVNPRHLEPVTHLENMRRHFKNVQLI